MLSKRLHGAIACAFYGEESLSQSEIVVTAVLVSIRVSLAAAIPILIALRRTSIRRIQRGQKPIRRTVWMLRSYLRSQQQAENLTARPFMTQVAPSVGVQEGTPDLDKQRGGYQTANTGESLQGDGCQATGMQESHQGGAEYHTKEKGESLQGDEYQTSGLGESSYGSPTEPPPAYDNARNAGEPHSARRPPHIYRGQSYICRCGHVAIYDN